MAFNLIPKNDVYFEDFDRHIAVVRQMSGAIREGLAQRTVPKDLWARIKAYERQADGIVRDVLSRLESTFVTPIEREDIHLLTVSIDDVADALEAVTGRFDMFEITEPTEEVREMSKALDEMVDQLVVAIKALRTLKPGAVRDATGRVDMLEEQIDEQFRQAQRALFHRHPEAYDLVRWKEVYDHLEEAADHGRHVARTVNHILVRHS